MTKELQNNVVEHRYVKRADMKEFQGDLKKENTAEIKCLNRDLDCNLIQ